MRIQESAVYSLLNLMHLKIYKGLGVAGVAGVNWELQYLRELRELHYVIGPLYNTVLSSITGLNVPYM